MLLTHNTPKKQALLFGKMLFLENLFFFFFFVYVTILIRYTYRSPTGTICSYPHPLPSTLLRYKYLKSFHGRRITLHDPNSNLRQAFGSTEDLSPSRIKMSRYIIVCTTGYSLKGSCPLLLLWTQGTDTQ